MEEFEAFQKRYPDPIEAHRRYAFYLYRQGQFQASLAPMQYVLENGKHLPPPIRAQDYNYMCATRWALRDIPNALQMIEEAHRICPDNMKILANLGAMEMKAGRFLSAKRHVKQCIKQDPDNPGHYDVLAALYGKMGAYDKVKTYGHKALTLKDQISCGAENLARIKKAGLCIDEITNPIPAFDPTHAGKNIIAFALWGNLPRFIDNAVLNAIVAPIIYPGWTCRFYCDAALPKQALQTLEKLQAQVILMPSSTRVYHALSWRLQVVSDPTVDRYLIRDCDSVLNCQERVAVDEWLQSDRHFHLMRDFYTHTELILAGLWGGVRGVLPDLLPAFEAYYKGEDPERTVDQRFLRYYVWPTVKQSHLAHDSQFDFGDSRPFPPYGQFPGVRMHVGQDWSVNKPRPVVKGIESQGRS